jgi:metal-responsive CopG/Arc/MetJ family transcriptional regulator
MIFGMAVERLTVSIESDLASEVRDAAEADEQNVSAWLADAARRRLANRRLADLVAEWEREHGSFSPEELAAARDLVEG